MQLQQTILDLSADVSLVQSKAYNPVQKPPLIKRQQAVNLVKRNFVRKQNTYDSTSRIATPKRASEDKENLSQYQSQQSVTCTRAKPRIYSSKEPSRPPFARQMTANHLRNKSEVSISKDQQSKQPTLPQANFEIQFKQESKPGQASKLRQHYSSFAVLPQDISEQLKNEGSLKRQPLQRQLTQEHGPKQIRTRPVSSQQYLHSRKASDNSNKIQTIDPNALKRTNSINFTAPLPHITAQSWAIYDIQTQSFIKCKKEMLKREVASITKMMTFYTVLKIMEKYDAHSDETILTVSRQASRVNGTSACLKEGDQLSLGQLFYGLMLPSGNDAAYCLAEYFGEFLSTSSYGNMEQNVTSQQFPQSPIKYFLRQMNDNAIKLAMLSSHFDSPHGLVNRHNYSTASDICLLIAKCMQIEKFREVVCTQKYETTALVSVNSRKRLTEYKWENTNKLLSRNDGFIGCKTGITTAAGPCFAGCYEKENERFAVVVLASKSMESRWIEVPKMVSWALKRKKVAEESKAHTAQNKLAKARPVSSRINLL